MENSSKQNWALLIIGFVMIGFAIYRYYQEEAFKKNMGTVNGVIKKIHIDRTVKNNNGDKYTADIEYNVNGNTYTTNDYSNQDTAPWREGDAIELNYNLSDPADVRIACNMKYTVLWAAAAGLFLMGAGGYGLYRKKAAVKNKP
jgi:hypothetical protein